jgi:hypothetical protein
LLIFTPTLSIPASRTAAPSVKRNEDCVVIHAFPIDAIQFEEVKPSQSDGGGSFKLSLYASVKVSLMMM